MANNGKHVREVFREEKPLYVDLNKNTVMTRPEFVQKIVNNQYPAYHVRNTDNGPIPASNPDKSKNNNLHK
jgi:hypothetical protein